MLIYLNMSTNMCFLNNLSDLFLLLLLLLHHSLTHLLMHLIDITVDCTKLYSHGEKAGTSFEVTSDTFPLFLGRLLLSGYISLQTAFRDDPQYFCTINL